MLTILWNFPLKSVFASRHGNCLQGLSLCVQRKLLRGMVCLCGFLQVLQPDSSTKKIIKTRSFLPFVICNYFM